jgi:UPF0716 family protein affecting phage T7 exclusion
MALSMGARPPVSGEPTLNLMESAAIAGAHAAAMMPTPLPGVRAQVLVFHPGLFSPYCIFGIVLLSASLKHIIWAR